MLVASSYAVCCVDFSIGAKSLQIIRKWNSKCKFSCLELVSGLILRVHTEILYFKTLQTLLGACEQTKRSKKLFISVPSRIDLERHGR